MQILTDASRYVTSLLTCICFCVVLLLVQHGEGMASPVSPSNLPSNGKKHECYFIVSFTNYTILIIYTDSTDRCSTVSSFSGQGDS